MLRVQIENTIRRRALIFTANPPSPVCLTTQGRQCCVRWGCPWVFPSVPGVYGMGKGLDATSVRGTSMAELFLGEASACQQGENGLKCRCAAMLFGPVNIRDDPSSPPRSRKTTWSLPGAEALRLRWLWVTLRA